MKEKYSKPEGDKELSEAEVRECVCMRASYYSFHNFQYFSS